MNGILENSSVEKGKAAGGCCGASHCECDAKEVLKRIDKGVQGAKAAVSDKVMEAREEAARLAKGGRYAVEDGMSEATHKIKRNPLGALGMAFAAGAALGLLLAVPKNMRRG